MADTQLTAAQIIADFGSYYQNGGQGEQDLLMRPYEQFGTREALSLIPTEDTILRLSDVQVSEILQAYQDDFTPKGGVTFLPVQIPLTQLKVDQAFNPTFLQNTWLGFLSSNKTDRTTWPFVRWFIEKYLLGQLDEDLETKAIYKGSKAAIVAGAAGTAIGAMDGIRKQINAGITAGNVTPIPTGALSADPVTFCEQIEDFVAAIPEKYWSKSMTLNMSRTLARRYKKGRKKLYNENYDQESDMAQVDETEVRVAGRASMSGSDKIWMTLPGNYVLGVKGFSNKEGFEIEKVDRKVKLYTDFWMGTGYLQGDLLFTNDRDLV